MQLPRSRLELEKKKLIIAFWLRAISTRKFLVQRVHGRPESSSCRSPGFVGSGCFISWCWGGTYSISLFGTLGVTGKDQENNLRLKEVYLSVISNVGESNLLCKPLGVPSSHILYFHMPHEGKSIINIDNYDLWQSCHPSVWWLTLEPFAKVLRTWLDESRMRTFTTTTERCYICIKKRHILICQ